MAFMMPVVKNDWDIYRSGRSRHASEPAEKPGAGAGMRVRKVSESRSEGPGSGSAAAARAALSPHRSAPAMRSLSYCRAPPSRASLRVDSPGPRSARPTKAAAADGDKFHTRASAHPDPEDRSRCAGCVPYL